MSQQTDIAQVPSEVPCLIPANKVKFEKAWNTIREILIKQPLSSLIHEFLSDYVAPEETKWMIHADLNTLMQEEPSDRLMLRRRATVSLQCGISMHAYCDGMTLLESALKKVTDKSKRSHFSTKEQEDIGNDIVDGYLICTIAALMMKDNERIMEIFVFCLQKYLTMHFRMIPEFINPIVGIAMSTIQQYEARVKSDYFLEALIGTYTMVEESLSFASRFVPSMDNMKGYPMPRIFLLQLHVYFILQNDLLHRFECSEGFTSQSQYVSETSCQRHMFHDRSLDIERLFRLLTLSCVKLPLQYRAGPGGDRDPNQVLRTLFSLRREALTNVRVTLDDEKGGFKLVAKRDIDQHEMFLMESLFACMGPSIPSNPHCEHCRKSIARRQVSGSTMILGGCGCNQCSEVYCSETCRTIAYDSYHKMLCAGSGWHEFLEYSQLDKASSTVPAGICLSLKMLVMAALQGKKSLFEIPELKILVNDLDSNGPVDNLQEKTTESPIASRILSVFRKFRELCPDVLPHLTAIDLTMAYSTIAKNSIGTKDEMRLFVAVSFANHSCDANTIYPFNESTQKLIFQAARPIKAGQEITISYVSNGDYDSRQRVLKMVYGFDCTCGKCLIEADRSKNSKKKKSATGKKI